MSITKRFLSLLLTLCIVLGLCPNMAFAAELDAPSSIAQEQDVPFTDVKKTDWFYQAVRYAYDNGIMSGTSAANFSPDVTTTRGMVVTMLHRMEGAPMAYGANFIDVGRGQYYTDAIAWASANGIVKGYSNGSFGANDIITREQLASVLFRYTEHKNLDTTTVGSLSQFADADDVNAYAVDAMSWAVGAGLISGTTGVSGARLAPQESASRAQVASVLMRYDQVIAASMTQRDDSGENDADNDSKPEVYTVTFVLNYDNADTYRTVKVTAGDTVKLPSSPSRNGYTFGGWYMDESSGEKFDATTPITRDITLYAGWKKNAGKGTSGYGGQGSGNNYSSGSSGGGGYIPPSTTYYTVTFNANGGVASSNSLRVASGSTIGTLPTAMWDGHTFLGWFTAAVGGTQITTSTRVTSNMTAYAQWNTTEIGGGSFRITFDTNDGRPDSIFQVQNLDAGDTVTEPAEEPARELYRFTGWYLEPATVTEYDFSTPVVSNLTLYAGWGNPDGSDEGLYAASNETETIYSITGIDVVDNEVIVTYNTNSQCLMAVEFFEDQMTGSDWSEEAQT